MIGMVEADGSVSAIYCHWDGYVSHVGKILDKSYDSDIKVAELLAMGDLSALGEDLDCAKLDGTNSARSYGSVKAYREDLGSYSDEFRYLFDGAAWFFVSDRTPAWDDVREELKDIQHAKVA
jgi:hypothetical protein